VKHFLAAAMLALLLQGCSPAAPLNLVAQDGTLNVERDIAYGSGPRAMLDVYAPPNAKNAPVVVFFYGGNWQSGARGDYRFVAAALARRGMVVVVPDYRLYPPARYRDFLADGAHAVAWAKRNIAGYGGNTRRIVLMGHSAGAHIAAMLALDGQWLAAEKLDPRKDLAGLVGIAGPYDFLPLKDENLKTIFADSNMARTQPITFVQGREAPALLITGTGDSVVDPGNTTRLAAKLRAKGDHVEERLYPGVGHLTIVGAFSPLLRWVAPTLPDITAFVTQTPASAS